MEHYSEPQKLPNWLMIVIFLAMITILFFLGDLFTFIIGFFVMAGIFAAGYDKNPANHENH